MSQIEPVQCRKKYKQNNSCYHQKLQAAIRYVAIIPTQQEVKWMYKQVNFTLFQFSLSAIPYSILLFYPINPSKHFLFSKTSWRRLQRNTFRFPRPLEDVFKTYLQYVFLKCLQDVFKTCLQDVLQLCLQDVLEDKKMLHWRRLEEALKTSSVRLHQDECLLGCLFCC